MYKLPVHKLITLFLQHFSFYAKERNYWLELTDTL